MAEPKIDRDEVEEIFDPEEEPRINDKARAIIASLRHIGPMMRGDLPPEGQKSHGGAGNSPGIDRGGGMRPSKEQDNARKVNAL